MILLFWHQHFKIKGSLRLNKTCFFLVGRAAFLCFIVICLLEREGGLKGKNGFASDICGIGSQSFSYESPDVNMEVTTMVGRWLDNTRGNNGMIVKWYDKQEDTTTETGNMEFYSYKGISEGKYVEGDIEALNQDEASHKLKEQKVIITNLIRTKKKKGEKKAKSKGSSLFGKKKAKVEDILIFSKQFATMVKKYNKTINVKQMKGKLISIVKKAINKKYGNL